MYSRVMASSERLAVAFAIVTTHGALLVWLLHLRSPQPAAESEPETSTILELLARIEAPAPSLPPKTKNLHRPSRLAAKALTPEVRESGSADSSQPLERAPVDWTLEAESAASAMAEKMAQSDKRRCLDSPQQNSWLPVCPQVKPGFLWDPEPKKVGFAGILPYVRLGKHCVLGLGFAGCAIGKLPAANGHLFDALKDRDQSER